MSVQDRSLESWVQPPTRTVTPTGEEGPSASEVATPMSEGSAAPHPRANSILCSRKGHRGCAKTASTCERLDPTWPAPGGLPVPLPILRRGGR